MKSWSKSSVNHLVIYGKNFQESIVTKVLIVKLCKARIVTLEQLVVMFSALNLL